MKMKMFHCFLRDESEFLFSDLMMNSLGLAFCFPFFTALHLIDSHQQQPLTELFREYVRHSLLPLSLSLLKQQFILISNKSLLITFSSCYRWLVLLRWFHEAKKVNYDGRKLNIGSTDYLYELLRDRKWWEVIMKVEAGLEEVYAWGGWNLKMFLRLKLARCKKRLPSMYKHSSSLHFNWTRSNEASSAKRIEIYVRPANWKHFFSPSLCWVSHSFTWLLCHIISRIIIVLQLLSARMINDGESCMHCSRSLACYNWFI